jgi:lipopolysaccharide export system protein LptA
VVAIQNNVTVRGNELIAEYDQDPQNITQLIARDNVTIQTPEINARADQAVYQIPDQLLTLTGYDLRLTTPTETIMARDRMTFDRGQNRARAIGNAVINTGDTTLRADQLTGNFIKKTDGDNGNLALQSVRADGNIVIRTATEVVRGQRGIYNRQDQTAEIRGKVKITRGDNQLNGDRAIVNLVSGDSRLIGGTDAGGAVDDGRVRALIGNTETTNDDGGQDE